MQPGNNIALLARGMSDRLDTSRPMNKLIHDVLRHLLAMWRYRWAGLLTAFLFAVVGAGMVFLVPKKFDASARVYMNTDSILKPLMAGMTVQPDSGQRVGLLSRLIISRPNVEQLLEQTGLAATVHSTEQRERLIDDVIKVLEIQSYGEHDNVYVIRFRDTNPTRAKRMVELLVNKFVNASKGGRVDDTASAKRFLDEQATLYEKKLQEAEGRLKNFKMEHMVGTAAGEGKDFFAQLSAVAEQLELARLQLHEAETARDAYRRGLAGAQIPVGHSRSAIAGESTVEIDARIDGQKRALDTLLQKYTDVHPDVTGARRVIADLELQRRQRIVQQGYAGTPAARSMQVDTVGTMRASEQLKVALAQAEASVASLQVRVGEYTTRSKQLHEAAKRMPEFEAELAQLNRDYDVNKKNYENLIARRESASIAGDMQSVSGVADFRLIDPPRVSPASTALSRTVLLAASLLVALVAGAALMFLLKELRGRVHDAKQLHEMTGLPVLGVVSMVVEPQVAIAKRRATLQLARAAGALFGIYALIVTAGFLITRSPA